MSEAVRVDSEAGDDPREKALREFCEQERIDVADRDAPLVVGFLAGYSEGYGAALNATEET